MAVAVELVIPGVTRCYRAKDALPREIFPDLDSVLYGRRFATACDRFLRPFV